MTESPKRAPREALESLVRAALPEPHKTGDAILTDARAVVIMTAADAYAADEVAAALEIGKRVDEAHGEGQFLQISFMGHVELTGYVTEITVGGQPAFHVDLPERLWGGNPMAWEEYAASALYSRRPVTEESVRKAWEAQLERARRRAEQEAAWARADVRALEAGDDGEGPAF